MSTIISNFFSINGVISTDRTVMQNITELCNATGVFLTYDINEGLWSFVINTTAATSKHFNDNNIIGNINISGSGIHEMYNSVSFEFPHKDIRDQTDFVDLEIPEADRFPYELDNKLDMSTNLINDPAVAHYLAAVELKQSRLDKIISFKTDYSSIGLKAGVVISVTNETLGYTNKLFRVTRVEEEDNEELLLNITALEYDPSIYSTAGLIRTYRSKKTGITPKSQNAVLLDADNTTGLKLELTDSAKAQGLSLFYVPVAAAAAYSAGTWFIDWGGKQVGMAGGGDPSDVIITWTYQDGRDLDIRCRMLSPYMGQATVDDTLGWTGGDGTQFPPESTRYWPLTGTPVLEWGGDNTGEGGNIASSETVRVSIQQLKSLYPNKRYLVVECYGNWYGERGAKPVKLVADLYKGGTTTLSEYTFTNTGASDQKYLDGVEVYVNSFEGAGGPGATTIGDLMGYFMYDTHEEIGRFVTSLPYGYEE